MSDYTSNLELSDAAAWLGGTERVTILTHTKPDGDAWGSVVALTQVLRAQGKTVFAAFTGPVPASLANLPGHELITTFAEDDEQPAIPDADCVVIVDTGAWSQCQPYRAYLEPRLDRTLILDHHLSGDIPATRLYIDSTAAAACQIIAELLHHKPFASEPLPGGPLYVGLATDTGFFRFSNTSPAVLRLAADLIDQGVDQASLYEQLELCERHEKLELMRCAMDSLQWVADGKAAVMVLRKADFERTGARLDETDQLVNLALRVAAVRVSVLLTERNTNGGITTRLSFRSKAVAPTLDVAQLAGQFGGGGHARAAGGGIDAEVEAALPRVVAALEAALRA